MELLGLDAAALVAYIAIAPDGAVTAWPTSAPDAETRTAAALLADERLHLAPGDEWNFD